MKSTKRAQHGFSLLEMIVVVMIAFIVMSFAVMNTIGSSRNAKANAAMDTVVAQLRQARELAIAKRRNVQVDFTAPNQIQLTVLTLPGEVVPPVIAPTFLNDNAGGGSAFYLFPTLPDTPMGFGNSTAINLQQPTGGGAWTVMFTSSGAFAGTSQSAATLYQATSNNPVNASIFTGVAGEPDTARAITVLGATGRVRAYRWTGGASGTVTNWVE